MSKGWILLHRQITESAIWNGREPYDRRSAWIDLLLMVNHQDKQILMDGKPVIIHRGQTLTSVRKLADRWGWSPNRVTRYLHLLEELQMIKKDTPCGTVLTIVNYDNFQDVRNTGGDTYGDSNGDTDGDKHGAQTNKVKNVNNVKKFTTRNSFTQIEKNQYDFDALEKLLGGS